MAFSLRKNLFKFNFTFPKRNFRMSATQRAEEAIEELKTKNPFFEKYAAKLAAAQQSSPEEFLKKVEERTKITAGKKKDTSDGRNERFMFKFEKITFKLIDFLPGITLS